MNYTEVKSAVAAFLNRDDLTSVIPTFIKFCESRMNRTIRTRLMEYRVVASISTQFSNLPDDFMEMRNIQINSQPVVALQYLTPQQADQERQRNNGASGKPAFFSVVANRLELIPPPNELLECELVYYRMIPALDDTVNMTNWVSSNHSDVYVYGTLVAAATYLKDDPSGWAQLFDSALEELSVDDQRSQFHGTTPQMRGNTIG